MMSATHFEPSKETGNITPKPLATAGVASKVDHSGTLDSQIAGIAVEKDMEEHAEKHQDSLSQEYPGPMLTFSDAPSKPAFDVLGSSATSAPEAYSAVVWVTGLPAHERSAPVFDPDELREIFPTELPPRPAPKSSFFSRMLKRSTKQPEDIEMGPQTSPKRQSPRYTLLPVKCHWSFLVGGWVFVMSCGAIAYWGVSEQLNKGGSDSQVVAAMLKR